MQTRRSFFASIAGLFVAAKNLDPSFYSQRPDADLEMISETGPWPLQEQMRRLTGYMHKELLKMLPGFPPVPQGSYKIGNQYPYQYGIDFAISPEDVERLTEEQIRHRHVLPAMSLIAREVLFKGGSQFAELPHPHTVDSCAIVTGGGISIRGLRAFDFQASVSNLARAEDEAEFPEWITRFDVLFG